MGTIQKLSSIAAAVLLVISLGLGAYGYATPYSYVNIDINPSVEITTNMFDRIIKVEALNDDAVNIVTDAAYKNKSLQEGIDIVLANATKEGYLTNDNKNAVMITISGKNDKRVDSIKKNIEAEAKTELVAEKVKAEVVVEDVNIQKHDDARKVGISPGKMLLIEKLHEVDPQAKVDDYKDATVKEILKNIQSAKRLERVEDKGDTQKNGSPSGYEQQIENEKDNKDNKNGKGNKGIKENSSIKDNKDVKDSKGAGYIRDRSGNESQPRKNNLKDDNDSDEVSESEMRSIIEEAFKNYKGKYKTDSKVNIRQNDEKEKTAGKVTQQKQDDNKRPDSNNKKRDNGKQDSENTKDKNDRQYKQKWNHDD